MTQKELINEFENQCVYKLSANITNLNHALDKQKRISESHKRHVETLTRKSLSMYADYKNLLARYTDLKFQFKKLDPNAFDMKGSDLSEEVRKKIKSSLIKKYALIEQAHLKRFHIEEVKKNFEDGYNLFTTRLTITDEKAFKEFLLMVDYNELTQFLQNYHYQPKTSQELMDLYNKASVRSKLVLNRIMQMESFLWTILTSIHNYKNVKYDLTSKMELPFNWYDMKTRNWFSLINFFKFNMGYLGVNKELVNCIADLSELRNMLAHRLVCDDDISKVNDLIQKSLIPLEQFKKEYIEKIITN